VHGEPGAASPLVIHGVLLASDDALALAALLATLAGRHPLRDVPAIERAHHRGLGCADLNGAKLVGDPSIAAERWWQPAATPRSRLDRLLDRMAPLAGIGPPPERRAYEDWVYYTSWGRLFRVYQRRAMER
jgi:hypothetical protein